MKLDFDQNPLQELIQLETAHSYWANVPEEVRRQFGLCRRPRPRR